MLEHVPHADGEILNDEMVIIHPFGLVDESEIFEPHTGVHLLDVLGDVGGRYEALWERCSLDALVKGPWSRAIRARTPVIRPPTTPGVRFTTPRDGLARVCVTYHHCRSMDVILIPGPTSVADDAASVLVRPEPFAYKRSVRSGHQARRGRRCGLLCHARRL